MAEYLFTFDVIASDRDGYYIDRWDRSKRFEVIGATEAAAREALRAIVGKAPTGRFWKARQVGTAKVRSEATDLGARYERLRTVARSLVTSYDDQDHWFPHEELEKLREELNTP